jgi:hypothetical protein
MATAAANRLPPRGEDFATQSTMMRERLRRYHRVARRRGAAATMDAPARRRGHALRLAVLVFIQYALLAADIRFVASANYAGVAVANVCIAINTWYLTRGIVEAKSTFDRVCFVVGGTAGALVAVVAT